ncbi:UNVERIFIED_CONTAM: LacI family DNA-binding transcriptional regulator [Streptococcus canis]|uniref:HTH-type transcriptional regulator MalR n=2 Tax=Streptococcus canis TaxID=1329 RepID=A0A2D4DPS7_STRCB|nr:LacI family DNA-binding transcriptional regulator [Streptococcus canis]EIQ82153.1 LacI family transcriptional repressor [Streptococcus canis FSL Z3-227]MDV5994025.1 LacI family DNA-binding transcriptional regulator [Streptococcus canis]MDV6001596.1 LacI family DNA-binding transcriptional regulator [Streptococcus canis]MDV6022927.1 LacI family DNA-binding transcriptional regulator [Streptococcus canis]MDW7797070.1 LacI family DNA-binding transcriptional regulator [Streptococcus canis]
MVTIKDVAQKAGVNPSTVSRVLKDNRSISQKTKEKVRKAMADLGYVPNVAAQMLASGLTHNIGLVFPPIMTSDRLSEPFFMEILSTITSEAKNHHFTVSIATGMSLDDLLEQVKLMHLQKRVDGFIILYSVQEDPVRKYLMSNKIPFVIVGAPEGDANKITYIDNDNQLMAKTAVDHLYQKGHRQILFITDDLVSEVASERYIGYLKGCLKLSLETQPMLLFDRKDPVSVESLMENIRAFKATALVVIGDVLSVRMVQLLSFYNIKVPDDMSIITFNNSSYAKLIHPYLTTFDINVANLGKTSFKQLLDIINSKEQSLSQKIFVPFTLKKRESVRDINPSSTN